MWLPLIIIVTICLFILLKPKRLMSNLAPGTNLASDTEIKPFWTFTRQAFAIGTLLAILICVLFPKQAGEVFIRHPLIVIAIAATITILCIGGDPQKVIKLGHRYAYISLITLLVIYIFWPAAEKKAKEWWPKKNKSTTTFSLQISQHRKGGPDFLRQGERIVMMRKDLAKPTPIRVWLSKVDGSETDSRSWPTDPARNAGYWLTNNLDPNGVKMALELPQGLTLDDIALKLVGNQTASDQQRPATRTIQPRPGPQQNKKIEGDIPRNLEIIS